MDTDRPPNEPIEFIGWHDAWIGRIELPNTAQALIVFDLLYVFFTPVGAHGQIWTYRGCLRLETVTCVRMDGPLDEEVVMQGSVRDAKNEEVFLAALLQRRAIAKVEMDLFSGARFEFSAAWATIEALEPISFDRTWQRAK